MQQLMYKALLANLTAVTAEYFVKQVLTSTNAMTQLEVTWLQIIQLKFAFACIFAVFCSVHGLSSPIFYPGLMT